MHEARFPWKGTYVLVIDPTAGTSFHSFSAGALGRLELPADRFYLYVGSAFGPGGVQARVTRHMGSTKRSRWHIDYLLSRAPAARVWAACTEVPDREHEWVGILKAQMGLADSIAGFGSSGCECRTHLLSSRFAPSAAVFRWLTASRFPDDGPLLVCPAERLDRD